MINYYELSIQGHPHLRLQISPHYSPKELEMAINTLLILAKKQGIQYFRVKFERVS